jgi:tetratricopeptide (TPR) repeat protein
MFRRALSLGGEAALRRSHGFGDYWCGRYPEAEREFRLMNAIDPENALSWWGLGLIEVKRENWDGAMTALNRAIELDPNSIDAYRTLAWALAHLRRNKGAIAAYEHSLKLALKGHRPLKALAITEVPRNTLLDPDHFKIYKNLADLYELEGDNARALAAFRFCVGNGGNSFGLRWRLARLYFKTRLWRDGLRETLRAIAASISAGAGLCREGFTWTIAQISAFSSLIVRK